MIHVIATSRVKPECREAFLALLLANVPRVLAEKGCLAYTPCTDVEGLPHAADGSAVTLVEAWESLEHLKAHFEAPHMKTFVAAVKEMRLSSSVRIVEPV